MAMPVAGTKLGPTLHVLLHNERVNVKAFGATGDGTTDDTAAINAALTAATAASMGGLAEVVFPTGTYKITSAISLPDGRNVKLTGGAPGYASDEGTVIRGNIATQLITKTGINNCTVIFEDMHFLNEHTAGTCVNLTFLDPPSGFYRCSFEGFNGIALPSETFNVVIADCRFRRFVSAFPNSIAIQAGHHTQIRTCDIAGYYEGIRLAGSAMSVLGGRIEVCYIGINVGVDSAGAFESGTAHITGINFEACDTPIVLSEVQGVTISSINAFGHANGGCPTVTGAGGGNNQEVIKVAHAGGPITLIDIQSGGTLVNGLLNTVPAGSSTGGITLIGCFGPWATIDRDWEMIKCFNSATGAIIDQRHLRVVATASLPAAASAVEDGLILIEDGGAGNRNLIIYAGGQRFRIDGGAAV